jgi:hypothetical protein
MSISYSLELADPFDKEVVADRLATVPGLARDDDGISAPDLFVSVNEAKGLIVELVKDDFGFVPRVSVRFRPRKDSEWDEALSRMVRAFVVALQLGAGDAVALFNSEKVVLLRRNGELLLNRDLEFWTEPRLALVTLPYRVESIPY